MRKELKVIAVVLVAVLVFLGGFGLGASKGISITITSDGQPAAAAPAATPAAPAAETTQPTAPAANPVADVANAVSEAASEVGQAVDNAVSEVGQAVENAVSGVPSTPDEVVAAYVKAINDTKAYTGNVTIHKTNNVDLHVTDCSVSFLTSQVDSIVQKFITGSDDTWTFANGTITDGGDRTLNHTITPGDKNAALTAAQCASATATAAGDGYTMSIKLNSETSTFDGTNTVYPEAHSSCLDPLNLATMDISPAKITEANMTYPGATMEATVNGSGLLTKLVVNLPMSGSGTGKLGVSLSIGLEGAMNDTYEFTYA